MKPLFHIALFLSAVFLSCFLMGEVKLVGMMLVTQSQKQQRQRQAAQLDEKRSNISNEYVSQEMVDQKAASNNQVWPSRFASTSFPDQAETRTDNNCPNCTDHCPNCTCPNTNNATASSEAATLTPLLPVLRDLRIVMIGDSLMRYQYLSLVYRLRHGVWFDNSMWYFHLVNEHTFRAPYHENSWGAFLYHTNQILQPFEVCDCYRKSMNSMEEIVENRYYYDPILNNSVVYLLSYGHAFPMGGRLQPDKVRKTPRGWQIKALQHYWNLTWQYHDWSHTILNHVQYLQPQPRFVVMNAGAWNHKFGLDQSGKRLTPPTVNLFNLFENTTLVPYDYVWRTTTYATYRSHSGLRSDPLLCERFPMCVNVSFTRNVRPRLYWDKLHFLEPVYRGINEQMLDQMGYLTSDYERMNLSLLE